MFYQPDKNFTYDIMEALRFYMQQYFVFLQQSVGTLSHLAGIDEILDYALCDFK